MKHLSPQLAVCLVLVTLVAVPAALAADGTIIYADGTCPVGTTGRDGTATLPICVGSPPNFALAYEKLPDRNGTIFYIFDGYKCEFPVQGGDPGAPTNCSKYTPPGTGAPLATALVWGLVGAVAIALVISGLLLRRRGSV